MHDNMLPVQDEEAVRARLAKLASVPVDASNLEFQLNAILESEKTPQLRQAKWRFFRPLTAMAAAILIALIIGIVLSSSGASPAMASPNDLARLHTDANAHSSSATMVMTVDQAQQILNKKWSGVPNLPIPPAGELSKCCVHQFMDRKVACLLLNDGPTPITMMVGYVRDIKSENNGTTIECGGHKFTQHRVDDVRILTTVQDGRFISLMGELPEKRMQEIAAQIKF